MLRFGSNGVTTCFRGSALITPLVLGSSVSAASFHTLAKDEDKRPPARNRPQTALPHP
jgi:hypothetical protein